MSDSEDASSIPSDTRIEGALRSAVAALFANDDLENLTVKRVRKSVEQQLNLSDDYFKTHARWAEKSKEVITAESEAQEANGGAPPSSTPQKPTPKKKVAPKKAETKKAAPKPKAKASAPAPKKPAKRQQDTKPKPRKRRKTSTSSDEDLSSDNDSASDIEQPKKSASPQNIRPGRKNRALPESDDDDDDIAEDIKPVQPPKEASPSAEIELAPKAPEPTSPTKAEESDSSELSVIIDEEPKPKKKRQKKVPAEKTAKETKAKTKVTKPEKNLDPNDEEIKRLQGWLLKCGIRRLWGKELAAYDTPKAKINHLKELLKDVGMDGRYSVEKAKQIKERRELAAELDAVQEGAKRWGQEEESDQADEEARPRRRLAKGLQELRFLDSSGEDSG